MRIWTKEISAKILNARCKNSMSEHLDIIFTKVGDDFVEATMPLNAKSMQPYGIMHGGASCALAESVASTAANYCVSDDDICVGISIHANYLKKVKEDYVLAHAKPCHLGRKTQVWEIKITDNSKRLISTAILTLAVIRKTL